MLGGVGCLGLAILPGHVGWLLLDALVVHAGVGLGEIGLWLGLFPGLATKVVLLSLQDLLLELLVPSGEAFNELLILPLDGLVALAV